MEIWKFSKDATTEGEAVKSVLGGKGVGLVEMARAGLPVPPGIIIPTNVCPLVFSDKSGNVLKELAHAMTALVESHIGGGLVSVRSGAAVSMPGMMDTILNVGIHKGNVEEFGKVMGMRAALDCYRRLIQMYGVTVKGIEVSSFQAATKEVMTAKYGEKLLPKAESDMNVMRLEKLIAKYMAIYEKDAGKFPQTLEAQLTGAIGAVFNSWNSERAIAYRVENKIPHDMYTACIVQRMVFGNLNTKSCSGVLFSRDPATGENVMYGDFLSGGQGEEVVSGSANTQKIAELPKWNKAAATELFNIVKELELGRYQDMVDTEFTVENGKVWMLQVRIGKRSAAAAFKIAYDMATDQTITKAEALKRVSAAQYVILSKPQIDPAFKGKPQITGVAASKGVATGRVWLSSKKAQLNKGGILVSHETTPDDFAGMAASVGILTKTGGATSHAAVVARAMDRACVVGCNGGISINAKCVIFNQGSLDAFQVMEGDPITIDGSTGNVYVGEVPMVGGKVPEYVNDMIEWGAPKGVVLSVDPSKDSIPEAGEVYLNMTNVKTTEQVVAVVHGLSEKTHGILNFGGDAKFDDSKFLKALCLSAQVQKATIDQIAGLAVASNNAIAKKFTLLGVELEQDIGSFKVHKKAKTMAEMLGLNGYYEMDDSLVAALAAQGLGPVEFVALLKNAGQNLTTITKPISREQMAFQVFGK